MVSYHFQPLAGSCGIQRALRFAQHLLSLGWRHLVLSAPPCACEKSSSSLLIEMAHKGNAVLPQTPVVQQTYRCGRMQALLASLKQATDVNGVATATR